MRKRYLKHHLLNDLSGALPLSVNGNVLSVNGHVLELTSLLCWLLDKQLLTQISHYLAYLRNLAFKSSMSRLTERGTPIGAQAYTPVIGKIKKTLPWLNVKINFENLPLKRVKFEIFAQVIS